MPMQSESERFACKDWYRGDNRRLFTLMSIFLNLAPDYIDGTMIREITGVDKSNDEFAFASIAASACGLDVYGNQNDRRFFRDYFLPMFRKLDPKPFRDNPYYRNIKLPQGKSGNWTFETRVCKPYEAFVWDDPTVTFLPDGGCKVIPNIGFFDEAYEYPAVLEGGREWMTLMPNETGTSEEAVRRAHGRVLTFGLGLGYFTYMAAINPSVSSVTVVEKSEDAAKLFCEHILPQFPDPSKVKIELCDAFDFAERGLGAYDMIFTDIWHDPSDGTELYLRMKEYEKKNPGPDYVYWIEKTLQLYI